MSDVKETIKDTFSVLLNKAQTLGKTAVDTAKDAAEKGKTVVEEKLREREAERHFLKLGKKVYKLVKRNELTLPEACEKYIDALNELLDELDDTTTDRDNCCCCCKGEKDDDCRCDKDDCRCDKDDCRCGKDDCRCDKDDCRCDKDDCRCDKDDCRCDKDDCRADKAK